MVYILFYNKEDFVIVMICFNYTRHLLYKKLNFFYFYYYSIITELQLYQLTFIKHRNGFLFVEHELLTYVSSGLFPKGDWSLY